MYTTKQEVFDAAVKGLASQGFQQSMADLEAIGKVGCAYRGSDGLRCAVGHLIPDSIYTSEMEDMRASALLGKYPEVSALFSEDISREFLDALQWCHDTADYAYGIRSMQRRLRDLAARYKLSLPPELAN